MQDCLRCRQKLLSCFAAQNTKGSQSTKPAQDTKDAPSSKGASTQELLANIKRLEARVKVIEAENRKLRSQAKLLTKGPESSEKKQSATSPKEEEPSALDATGEQPETDKEGTDGYTLEDLEEAINWPKSGDRFWETTPRDTFVRFEDVSPPGKARIERVTSPMHVVHMGPELAPCAKVGGLGDVVQGLAKASMQRGHYVQVCASPAACHMLTALTDHARVQTAGSMYCQQNVFWRHLYCILSQG
jgi:hypothetical protein